MLASLDVENLFSNVPVKETIGIFVNNICNNPSLTPLKIKPNILSALLLTGTTEVSFYDHLNNIYTQEDDVSRRIGLGSDFQRFLPARS